MFYLDVLGAKGAPRRAKAIVTAEAARCCAEENRGIEKKETLI